jgi:outer membrane lipoprotein-sorting protein
MNCCWQLTLNYVLLGCSLLTPVLSLPSPVPAPRKGKLPPALAEILSHMNERGNHLRTVAASLEYTKVTVLVNDKSTEYGQLFFHKGRKSKNPEICIEIQKPESKTILFKKNKAEIYLPKINQIQEYNLERHSGLVQQFLLLGFGSETSELRKSYNLRFLKEEDMGGGTTAALELVPRKESLAAQVSKIQIWVSEESWLPVQQQFFESGGDYLIARYTAIRVNRAIASSTFEIHPAKGVKRIQMN